MKLVVKNGVLTLSKQEAAQIACDAINYMVDDEFPEEMQNTLSYPVEVDNDGNDVLGKKNVNFSNDCVANVEDERCEGWKKQRLERGFDDTELWNLDATILQFIIPRLKEYREMVNGYPGLFNSADEWHNALDEMIWAMEWYVSEDIRDEFKKDKYGNFFKDENGHLVPTEEHQRAKNGWKLFCENFFSLWD